MLWVVHLGQPPTHHDRGPVVLPVNYAPVAFLSMAAALGVGNGAVFALVGTRAPATKVGAVTGFVGAAGGLGGFLPPLVMGAVFEATSSYAIGLALLCLTALTGMAYTYRRFARNASSAAPG